MRFDIKYRFQLKTFQEPVLDLKIKKNQRLSFFLFFLKYREDLIQVTTTLASSRSTTIGTPGAQVGFIPTGTAVPCLVYTPRPYFFD